MNILASVTQQQQQHHSHHHQQTMASGGGGGGGVSSIINNHTNIQSTITKKSTRSNNNLIQTNDVSPPSTSRTPETSYTNISYGGGLKFTYEAQPNPAAIAANLQQQQQSVAASQMIVKDSPPSSPESEAGSSSRKRGRKSDDLKDIKVFQNGVLASHMLGNQLNPSSSVAQKMSDQLNMEMEAHSAYTSSSLDSGPQLIGPSFPGKNVIHVSCILFY